MTTITPPRVHAAHVDEAPPAGVELREVVKDYGAHRALKGMNLALHPGELVALLGPSGCGKTTALRALAGLEGITSGALMVDGADVAPLPTNKRDMGMVFQSYSLFPHMTAQENVEFGLRMRRVGKVERAQRASQMLASVGLEGMEGRYAHQLSGGQQQRVALARALVTRPRVLLLDEPLSALDAKVRIELRELIRRVQTELGITTLFVTHDQEEALAIADRVAVMNAGVVEQIGSPEELYSRPQTAFVAQFIGLSNEVLGELKAGVVSAYGTRFDCLPGADAEDGPVVALIRPQDVRLVPEGLPAEVLTSSFLGSHRHTVVRLEDRTVLTVHHEAHDARIPGSRVGVAFTGSPVAVRSL